MTRLLFTFPAMALFYLANSLQASSIVGGWYATHAGQADSTVGIAFLANGEYVEVEDGNSILDPSGQDGMERGTYTWNPATGAFSFVTLLNTNGQWGLSDATCPPCTLSTVGDTLIGNIDGNTGPLATRMADPLSAVVGTWFFRDSPAAGDLTVLMLLPNGQFLIGIDPPATGFIESGTYSWNPITGAFTAIVLNSTAPPASQINLALFTSAGIQNDNLVLSSTSGNLNFSSAAVPEPATFGLATFGLGLMVLTFRRKRQSQG